MANFYHRFLQSVNRWPDTVAFEVQHQTPSHVQPSTGTSRASGPPAPRDNYTFAQVRRISDGVAHWLTANQPGRHHCAILAANGPRWVATFLGILAAGNVVVPLDTALKDDQIRKLLQASDTALLFTDSRNRVAAERAAEGLPVRIVLLQSDSTGREHLDAVFTGQSTEPFNPVDLPPDEAAGIFYSSGTTGDPKGVMLTHDNFAAETDSIFAVFTIGVGDSILGILPLFHVLALITNVLLPMAGGARVLFLESLNTTDLLRALPQVNIFVCVPQFFYLVHERIWKEVKAKGRLTEAAFGLMLKTAAAGRKLGLNLGKVFFKPVHRLLGENMRYLATGGSKFDAAIGREFEALGFTMLQGYGLTETTGAATYTPPGKVNIASVGRALPGVELKIVDPQQAEGGTGEFIGEIAIRGRIVMKGYYKRADATAASLPDGWLRTGDLGYVDADGNLFVTGRAKEMIVLASGKNIYPEEVEAHYLKSPLIKEICVLGLQSKPGEPFSERLHGVIVPNWDELRARKVVNTREMLRFELETLSVQLPSTKRILSYEFWQEDLPRTTTRKIKRFEVERRVREREAAGAADNGFESGMTRKFTDEDREWLSQSDVTRAIAVVRDAAKVKKTEIHPGDNLELDLGLDSMERVELLVSLERELGGQIEDQVASQVYTVRELVDAVRNTVGAGCARAAAPAWAEVLNEDPTDPEVLAVTRPRSATRFWYMATRLSNLLARDLYHLRVEGLDKLPRQGPFILCPNHQSFVDPAVLIGALPWNVFRRMFYVGTSEIFGNGILRRVARSLKLIPVDPDANLVPAMRAGGYGLRYGMALLLYPEGERSIDGTPKVFKKGAAILAANLKVPIYPVAMDGFFESWPRGKKFQKFTRTRIMIGDPLLPPVGMDNPEKTYETLTRDLRARVVAMWDRIHEELYGAEELEKMNAD